MLRRLSGLPLATGVVLTSVAMIMIGKRFQLVEAADFMTGDKAVAIAETTGRFIVQSGVA